MILNDKFIQIKNFLKKILPKPLLYIYWLFKVPRLKVINFVVRYNEDELITAHNCDFMKDKRFMECYNLAVKAGLAISDKIHWKVHVACWAAYKGKSLEGDFVECGVAKGFVSRIVMGHVDFKNLPKKFFLMDTYEGLNEKCLTETEKEKMKGEYWDYGTAYEKVKETFKEFTNVVIVKGVVPYTLREVLSDKIAYLHIDMNCVQPEIAAAEYFWDKLVSGAVMLLDDYGHAGHEEQKYAFDDFAKRKDVEILSLPTGQGLIIKP